VEHEEHEEHDAPDDFDYEPISTYTVIADLGPGDFFGEMALLSDAPRNASVVVTERCQVLALSRGAFNLYLEESQPAFQRLREIALARRYENQETYGF
jgi:CRP-like cAMP-binding protein